MFVLGVTLSIFELNHQDCSISQKPMSKDFVSTAQGTWTITEQPSLDVFWELALDNCEVLPWKGYGFEVN